MLHHRVIRVAALTAAAGVSIVTSSNAAAQARERGTMISDDGTTRRVLHYAQPDFRYAFAPDYEHADVPLFVETLHLNLGQRDVLVVMIDEYLLELERLLDQYRTDEERKLAAREREEATGGAAPGRAAPRNEGEGDGDERPRIGSMGDAQRNAIRDIVLDELRKEGIEAESFEDLPFGPPSIMIGASIVDEGEGPRPEIQANVSFGADDDSMSEELRRKLKAAAERIAPRIKEQVQSQMAGELEARMEGDGAHDDGFETRWQELERDRERFSAILTAKRALKERFETDVKATLTDEQVQRWPTFQRAITRRKTLPLGTLDGERTDLLALLKAHAPETGRAESVDAVAAEYESRLHEALLRRNELIESIDVEIDRALYSGEHRAAQSLADRITRARLDVRGVNDEFLPRLCAALGGSAGEALRAEAMEASYPRVYRDTISAQAFHLALKLSDLSPDQKAAIEELQRAHGTELLALNDALVRRIRETQAVELPEQIERVISAINGEEAPFGSGGEQDDLRQAFQQRQNLAVRYVRAVRGLLTPEQAAHLPEPPVTDVATPVEASDGAMFTTDDGE
jgi:hypothetical protein